MISGKTRLVGLLGHPVSDSLSPRMQNAAFAARGLDWAYVRLRREPEGFETAVRGLVAAGFAGANVTTPHKPAAAALAETDLPSVNTLVFEDGRIRGFSTDAAVLAGLPAERAVVLGDGGAAAAFREALPQARSFARRGDWPPDVGGADLDRQRDLGAQRGARRARAPGRRSSTFRTPRPPRRGPPASGERRSSTASRCSSLRARPRSSSGPACPRQSRRCGAP